MNDFEATASANVFELPRLTLVSPRSHPARPTALVATDSGPALARQFRGLLLRSDHSVMSLVATISVAVAVRSSSTPATFATLVPQLAIATVVVLLWAAMLWAFRTRDSRVLCLGVMEYKRIVSASAMTFGILGIAFVIFPVPSARYYFLVAFPIGVTGLLLERWLWRKWLARRSRTGQSLSRVVVVGTSTEVDYVVRQVRKSSGAAYSVVGAVVQSGGAGQSSGNSVRGLGIPVTDDLDAVADQVSRLGADAVIVAGAPTGKPDYVHDLAWSLEGTATDLIIATNLANVAGPRIHLRPVEGLPLIHVEIPQFEGSKHVMKRLFDAAAAGAAIVALAPLFAIIALCVVLDSPGPALFRQERVGRDGKLFTMLKFRSMGVEAESELEALRAKNEGAGELFKLHNDPRVTRVGRFIRKHSLDEFPQLWNILMGDMSIVGPRPPLPREVKAYEEHVHRRLYIRPGLTGMWQVNGRSTLDWEESVRLDLYYVENWSLVGDIVIVWRTFREIRNPMGAF